MNIERLLLTPNRFSRPEKKLGKIKGIVIHFVGKEYQECTQTHNYFEGLKYQRPTVLNDTVDYSFCRYASAHFIVGLGGRVIQCLPTSEMAYHVGASEYTKKALANLSSYPNNCTLGIELCHVEKGLHTEKTLKSAVELTATQYRRFIRSSRSFQR